MYCILLARSMRPGKPIQLSESEIRTVCIRSREIFLSQPMLLELEAPMKICGKLHDLIVYMYSDWKISSAEQKPPFTGCSVLVL